MSIPAWLLVVFILAVAVTAGLYFGLEAAKAASGRRARGR